VIIRSLQTRLLLACLAAMAVFAALLAAWLIGTALAQDDGEVVRSLARSTQAAAVALADVGDRAEVAQRLQFFDRINQHLIEMPPGAVQLVAAVFEGERELAATAGWPRGVAVLAQDGGFSVKVADRTWTGYRANAGAYSLVQMIDLAQARSILAPAVVTEVVVYVGLGFCAIAAALLLALRTGFRPLRTLASEVADRSLNDPRPFAMTPAYRELTPMVRALNDARRRDADSRERERKLIQESAHALSTPLMALEEQAAALRASLPPDDLERRLKKLARTAARSNRIARQLLKLAILDAGPASAPQPLDVMDMLRESLAEIGEAAMRRATPVELEGPEQLPWRTDETALRCIVDNLLSNAVKYGAGGRGIKVWASVEGEQLRIGIADDGPGIDESMRDVVFEPFRRVAKTAQDGAGLGLAIVRRACGQIGARVQLGTSADRKGCVFELTVPLAGAD
jgi:two-component system, OmpR family, sensor histidine kinase QseC